MFCNPGESKSILWMSKILVCYHLKVFANKNFRHSQKLILTYQICNTVVLDHLFQF